MHFLEHEGLPATNLSTNSPHSWGKNRRCFNQNEQAATFFFTFSKPCSLSNPSALQIDFHKVSVCGNTCLLKVTSLKAFSTLPLIPTPNNLFCCHISDPISVLFSHLSFSLMMIGFTRMLLCRISVSFSWLLCRLCCTQSMAMLLELPFGGFFFPSHEFLPFNLFSLSLCFFICSLAPF